MTTITATEAARRFSEILNTIKYTGKGYTIVRRGAPVATIGPAESLAQAITLGDLPELAKSLPALGDEATRFSKDLEEARMRQPAMPGKNEWE